MHDDETISMHAPFWAFRGAHRHLDSTVGSDPKINASTSNGDVGAGGGFSTVPAAEALGKGTSSSNDNSGVEHPHTPFDNGDVYTAGEGDIADNVDGFLDEFMALAGDDYGDSLMLGESGEGNGIAEEDLMFLDDVDLAAFLPPPAEAAGGPDAGFGGALLFPVSVNEIKTSNPVGGGGVASAPMIATTAPPIAARASSSQTGEDMVVSPVVEGGSGGTEVPGVADTTAEAAAPGVNASGGGAPRRNGKSKQDAAAASTTVNMGGVCDAAAVSFKEQLRRQKVARYLAKKARRRWSKASPYQSRQRVANSRPRHKGRFLPLESDFVSIAELQRRQRALMAQMREKAAAAAATAGAGAGAAAAASADVSSLPSGGGLLPFPELGPQYTI